MSNPLAKVNSKTFISNDKSVEKDQVRVIEDIAAVDFAQNKEYPKVSVIIPALNEEKSIGSVLKAIPRNLVSEIIVVDNGSTDRTAEVAKHCGAKIVLQPQRGYGEACLAGIKSVKDSTEIIVFVDADFSDYPEDLEHLLKPLISDEAEIVIGSRTKIKESKNALTPQQVYGNWLATTLVRLFWGHSYSDLGPFRAIKKEALDDLGMSDRNYGWTIEMQIKALQQKLKIAEVPVRYRIRIGQSKISGTVKGTVLAGTKIIFTIFKYAFKR